MFLAVGTSGQPNEDLSLFPLVMGVNGIVVIFKGKVVFRTLFNPETVFGNLLQGLQYNIPRHVIKMEKWKRFFKEKKVNYIVMHSSKD